MEPPIAAGFDEDVEEPLARLWEPADPASTEQRYRALLDGRRGADAALVITQIARTQTLRRHLDQARELLAHVENDEDALASPRVRARIHLEWARIARTERRLDDAVRHADDGFRVAVDAGEHLIAAEAAHLLSLLVRTGEDAIRWDEKALSMAREAPGDRARHREAVLNSTLGTRARSAGRLDAALGYFRASLQGFEALHDAEKRRIARWQVGNTLRLLGDVEEAWGIQTELKAECRREGVSDSYVDEELAALAAVTGHQPERHV